MDNSDYTKPRTKLFELLTDVYQSDVNKSLFANLFDRYLTKDETTRVIGYIGKKNAAALYNTQQIPEVSLHRQGHQLQPYLYTKVGAVDHISSWEDLLREAQRLGVDRERFDQWGRVKTFNWVPPIDIDKLIHYSDYYWYDPSNINSQPQYITVRNECAQKTAVVSALQRTIDRYGELIPIQTLHKSTTKERIVGRVAQIIPGTTPRTGIIIVEGSDVATQLSQGQYFTITGADNSLNNGRYLISDPVEVSFDYTTIQATGPFYAAETSSNASFVVTKYDQLVLEKTGYDCLFEPGFVFSIINTSNEQLRDTLLTTESYREENNVGIVTITSYTTDGEADEGDITILPQLAQAEYERRCQCGDLGGFDNSLFDGEGTLWDLETACVGFDTDTGLLQSWSGENKWLHKLDVPNFTTARRAQYPIIEYDSHLELNEWTYTRHNWQYRKDSFSPWEQTDHSPSVFELTPLSLWIYDNSTHEYVLDPQYGDLTHVFTPGTVIRFAFIGQELHVKSSRYHRSPDEELFNKEYKTKIQLVENVSTLVTPGNLTFETSSRNAILPYVTSHGDPWEGYNTHWMYLGAEPAVPVNHQVVHSFDDYHQQTISYSNQREFLLIEPQTPSQISGRSLRRRALAGCEDIRVYVDGVRQQGNYQEIGNTVLQISRIIPSQRKIIVNASIDLSFFFSPRNGVQQKIRVYGNKDNSTNTIYTVESCTNNEIVVTGAISSTATNGGYLYNITTPVDELFAPGGDVVGVRYVAGISFFLPLESQQLVDIYLGESAIDDIGLASVPVAPGQTVSLINYRKVEQFRTSNNQYPLFDMYDVFGQPVSLATPLFAYNTSSDAPYNASIGQRVVVDESGQDYQFQQYLYNDESQQLYAYRNYSAVDSNAIIFNQTTQQVMFWRDTVWSTKIDMNQHYQSAYVGPTEPENTFNGLYWFNTLTQRLFVVVQGAWEERDITITGSDYTLQTIWKQGLNDEQYIPEPRDWAGRTEEEYLKEQRDYIRNRKQALMDSTCGMTEEQAEEQLLAQWYVTQQNPFSPTGQWIGAWDGETNWGIPDPLFYNNSHENREVVTYRELLTHFSSIVDNQEKISGVSGTRADTFHLIPLTEVNYGVGGTIKEFNDKVDTFYSSLFVENVTPLTLFEFAQQQYEVLLNNLQDIFRKHFDQIFVTFTPESLTNFSSSVVANVLSAHQENDFLQSIYGDSTTYTDIMQTGQDLGIRNWIITLPYIGAIVGQIPEQHVDPQRGILEIAHHDGHRKHYEFSSLIIANLSTALVNYPDPRFDQTEEKVLVGIKSNEPPPDTIEEFAAQFGVGSEQQIDNREGVYWYNVPDRKLYRFSVANISSVEPPVNDYPEGAVWISTNQYNEGVYRKVYDEDLQYYDWRLVSSTLEDVWEVVDLNQLLLDVIYEAERKLYSNIPQQTIKYDFEQLRNNNRELYDQLLEEQFNQYVLREEVQSPYVNTQYVSTDPFTWNYKYSITGARNPIIEADEASNAFVISGDRRGSFCSDPLSSPCSANGQVFYVKNSQVNDGKWEAETVEYDSLTNRTIIYVNESYRLVQESVLGILYCGGMLPSSANTGGESAADWRNYYAQLFGTPYPHLEPWKLQGYHNKPLWWDQYYLNDQPEKWGDRRWKYKHGFEVVAVDHIAESFAIEGNFLDVFFKPATTYLFDRGNTAITGNYNQYWTTRSYEEVVSVVPGAANTARINIAGNHLTFFHDEVQQFVVVNSLNQAPQTFTVVHAEYNNSPPYTSVIVAEEIVSATGLNKLGCGIYTKDNRTLIYVDSDVPEPQSSTSIPYYARICHQVGMWKSIIQGIIPPGELYSNGIQSVTGNPGVDRANGLIVPEIPTYNYLCVNIGNQIIPYAVVDNQPRFYYPDDVFAPYWNYVTYFQPFGGRSSFDAPISSLFTSIGSNVLTPSANYLFGDCGPVEADWRFSTQYLYDQLAVAYKIDPIRLISSLFGIQTVEVGGLQIDVRTQNTPSHGRTTFHGEMIDSQLQTYNGFNQWFVNYNRYQGYDTSYSDFRALWTQWLTHMTYAFSSFVDQTSVFMSHRYVPVSEYDRRIVAKLAAKRSAGVRDYWLDAFSVSVIQSPPAITRYDNQAEWTFEVRTNTPTARTIEYYDVERYQYYVDLDTNTCLINTYPLYKADKNQQGIFVRGDQTQSAITGLTLQIVNTGVIDGTYQIVYSVYDGVNDATFIELAEELNDNILESVGYVTINDPNKTLLWGTGMLVRTFSDQVLPVPLDPDMEYFVTVLSPTSFRFARTRDEAVAGISVPLTSVGTRNHYVGLLHSTFHVLDRSVVSKPWQRYNIAKNRVKQFSTPCVVKGIQSLIDIVFGYAEYQTDVGWHFNNNNNVVDPSTGRVVSWELEVERFLEHIYGYQARIMKTPTTRFDVSVDPTTSIWTFKTQIASFVTGDELGLFTTNGNLPPPFDKSGIRYYMIRDGEKTFRLAATRYDAERDIHVEIDQDNFYDRANQALSIYRYQNKPLQIPAAEINPFRNGVAFRPSVGVVSDLYAGPTQDIRVSQLLFDQYGRALPLNSMRILREDKETTISVVSGINNDVSYQTDTYSEIHLGGAHIFVDVYEHTLLINGYTTEQNLLYDPFLGLYLASYDMQFERYNVATFRPNVGGFFLHDTGSQEFTLVRNFEASIEDLRKLYDTHTVSEFNSLTRNSRKVLGYDGQRDYFNLLGVNSKSQFLFWKGMIQHKGSINTVKALANSRRVDDLSVDEFWAIKDGEFGTIKEHEYPEIYLTTSDGRSNDLKLLFVDPFDFCRVGYAATLFDNECGYAFPEYGDVGQPLLGTTFTTISGEDWTRWHLYPDQMDFLRDNGFALYFDLRVVDKVNVHISSTPPVDPEHGMGWANNFGDEPGFYRWNSITNLWENHGKWASGVEDFDSVCSLAACYPGYETTYFDECNYSYPEQLEVIKVNNEKLKCGYPVIRHNLAADDIKITLKWYQDGTRVTIRNVTDNIVNESRGLLPYISKAGNLVVFKNGIRVYSQVDYYESSPNANELLSREIVFSEPLNGAVVDIVYVPCTLTDQVHYEKINSNIVRLLHPSLLSPIVKNFTIWGLRANERAHVPVKFIDTKSETVLETLQYWDPARGVHYNRSLQSIDIIQEQDPATYTIFLTQPAQPGEKYPRHRSFYWGKNEVGKTWLDTTTVGYVPYYDQQIFEDVEDRIRLWGQPAGWSIPRVYEWVESDVPPTEYTGGGTPYFTLSSANLNPNRQYVREIKQETVNLDPTVDARNTQQGYQFTIDGKFRIISTIVAVNYDDRFFAIDEDLSYRLDSGMEVEVIDTLDNVVGTWVLDSVEAGKLNDDVTTVLTATTSVGGILPTVHRIRFYPRMDVYVNGVLQTNAQEITPQGTIIIPDIREQDQVTLLLPYPSVNYLSAKIDEGVITVVNSYVIEDHYDDQGNNIPKYYFWVTGRPTAEASEKHLLSAYQAQQQLAVIPTPYIFFEQLASRDTAVVENTPIIFPQRFKGVVVRGLRGRINQNDRYILRFIRDFTLRDLLLPQPEYVEQFCNDLSCVPMSCVPGYSDDTFDECKYSYPDSGNLVETETCPANLTSRTIPGEIVLIDKDFHEEWILLREKQVSSIPRWLWDKVTEAIVGYHLYDSTQRVPSYDKELYDQQYGTVTRFGFGDQQALVDGQLAYQLILGDLQNPEIDFAPINLRDFFNEYSFDTPENIIEAMNVIYNTFSQTHVNRMFFNVIHTALALKRKYSGVFKTSFISVHLKQQLQTQSVINGYQYD